MKSFTLCFQSSSSTESDSLPFANENAGTIKQRAVRNVAGTKLSIALNRLELSINPSWSDRCRVSVSVSFFKANDRYTPIVLSVRVRPRRTLVSESDYRR